MYPTYSYSMSNNTISDDYYTDNNVTSNSSPSDDDQTVRTSNKLKDTHGLLDLGATDHFLAINSNVESSWPITNKINVVIPDGEKNVVNERMQHRLASTTE